MQLNLIKINSTGSNVEFWQSFLRGENLYLGEITSVFDEETFNSTVKFQMKHNLQPDGVVGNKTYGVAMQLGFNGVVDVSLDKLSPNWPPKPSFNPLVSNEERQTVFGPLLYVADPLPNNPENIKITNSWDAQNLITVHIPQLVQVKGNDKVTFHKLASRQLVKLWADWERLGLLHLVLTWAGSYDPRFVRGSRSSLSNHAFGTAFDINVAWNQLGHMPALVGQKGSVRELVNIANANGLYWGGHFNRQDGMHFEVAEII